MHLTVRHILLGADFLLMDVLVNVLNNVVVWWQQSVPQVSLLIARMSYDLLIHIVPFECYSFIGRGIAYFTSMLTGLSDQIAIGSQVRVHNKSF